MTAITFTQETGAVLQYVKDDFETYSVACIEHDRRVTTDGDIIFDIRDIWDFEFLMTLDIENLEPQTPFGEFLDEDVLQRWAAAARFSLDGINAVDALYKSIHAFILPTVSKSRKSRLRMGARRALSLESTRDSLPRFQLRVHRDVFRLFLIDVCDGPFENDAEWAVAMMKRRM